MLLQSRSPCSTFGLGQAEPNLGLCQPGMVSWSWSGSTWLNQQLVMPHFWTKLFDCPRIMASWPSFDSSQAISHFNPLLPRSGRPWESPSQPSIALPLPPLHCFPPAGVSHLPAIHPSASQWSARAVAAFCMDFLTTPINNQSWEESRPLLVSHGSIDN